METMVSKYNHFESSGSEKTMNSRYRVNGIV
jgi:hypothetical protein